MQIQFSAARPDADFVVLPVEKDGLARTTFGDLDTSAERVLLAAAKAGRFEGEAGAIVEAVVAAGEGVQRVALIGIGAGDADYERAGGALTARYLTSGTTALTVDFGALSGAPTPRAVARFRSEERRVGKGGGSSGRSRGC